MKNEAITLFEFEEKSVRTVEVENVPFFCLKDVCDILGIDNNRNVNTRIDPKGVHTVDGQNGRSNQGATFINEPNLYRVIFQSHKENAKRFQDWVFEVVLPHIRKTGYFENFDITGNKFSENVMVTIDKKLNDYFEKFNESETGKVINKKLLTKRKIDKKELVEFVLNEFRSSSDEATFLVVSDAKRLLNALRPELIFTAAELEVALDVAGFRSTFGVIEKYRDVTKNWMIKHKTQE